jgi:ABC-type phosphate transport system permease subunit
MIQDPVAAAIAQTDPKLRLQIKALRANTWQYIWYLLKEVRFSLLAAVIAGFGAVVSEVGASMMVGGNIRGETRVLTTATALEVSKGNFDIVSHDLQEICRLYERAIVLQGQIAADGSPAKLLQTKQIKDVETFLNHWSGKNSFAS